MHLSWNLTGFPCVPAPAALPSLYRSRVHPMTSRHFLLALLLASPGLLMAQSARSTGRSPLDTAGTMTPVVIFEGDTMPVYRLDDVFVVAVMTPRVRRRVQHADRLTRNVQKVFPYALTTAKLLDQYEYDLANIQRAGDRALYLKLAEAELKAEFSEELRNMSRSQGRLLIKLIDRETGHTGYELVRQLRGSFEAWVWQGVAVVFGNDLKDDYDPTGDDAVVESIVRRIENGELACTPMPARTAKAQARLEKRKERLHKRYGLTSQIP